jgi:hypothetical protein
LEITSDLVQLERVKIAAIAAAASAKYFFIAFSVLVKINSKNLDERRSLMGKTLLRGFNRWLVKTKSRQGGTSSMSNVGGLLRFYPLGYWVNCRTNLAP